MMAKRRSGDTVPANTGDLPLDTTHEGVIAAVRQRAFDDEPFWSEICRLRQEGDAVRIFNAFQTSQPLRFPGDVLLALMKMNPYPVPANRAEEPALHCTRRGLHPGPIENMNVVDIPEHSRVFELNTDWKRHAEFERPPSLAFVRMLDQIALGAEGEHDTPLAPDLEGQHMPWFALAPLSNASPEALALEILRDWGFILRRALAGQNVRTLSRNALAMAYQRTFLRWLVQRLAFERLRV